MESGRPPEAPPEWSEWKRNAFELSIQSAWMFFRGKEMDDIKGLVGKPEVTRQRISQMVGAGAKFLVDRRFVTVAQ